MIIHCIDIETTTLDPATGHVIEVAGVTIDSETDRCISKMQTLIQLPGGAEIPPESSAVHHIIVSDLVGQPTVEDAITDHLGFDGYAAHNAEFERSWLSAWLPAEPWICTYKCALRVWPEAPAHNLQTLRYWIGHIDWPGVFSRGDLIAHRALSDAAICAMVLRSLLREAPINDLFEWSTQPPLWTRIPFGKHRGEPLAGVPADYLSWILRSDLDADAKWNAKNELSRRATDR